MTVVSIEKGPVPQDVQRTPPGIYKFLKLLGNRAYYDDISSVFVGQELECDIAQGQACADLKVVRRRIENFEMIGIDYASIHVIEGDNKGDFIIKAEATYTDFATREVQERKPNIHVMIGFLEGLID